MLESAELRILFFGFNTHDIVLVFEKKNPEKSKIVFSHFQSCNFVRNGRFNANNNLPTKLQISQVWPFKVVKRKCTRLVNNIGFLVAIFSKENTI